MGLGLGVAILVGVAAGRADLMLTTTLMSGALLIFATITRAEIRFALVLAASGLAIGFAAAAVRADHAPPPITDVPSPMLVDITSDAVVGGRGKIVEGKWSDADGNLRSIRLFLPASATAGRGDQLLVAGYTPKQSAGTILYVDNLRRTKRAGWLDQKRTALRDAIEIQTRRAIPGSPGALVLGLLTGNDSGLTDSETDALRSAGLSHITAVSGWNVSVVIMTFTLVLRAMTVRGSWMLAILLPAAALYAWLVGLDPPIVRAAIMGAVALIAVLLGRPAHLYTPLALTAAVMALLDPEIIGSLSFQLSFFAMLGMGLASALIGRIERREVALIASALLTPVTAALMTAPIILDRFGYVSIYSVLANVLVAPLIIPLAAIGALAIVVHSIPYVGLLMSSLAWLMGNLVLDVAETTSGLPHARQNLALQGTGFIVLMQILSLAVLVLVLPEGRFLRRRANNLLIHQPVQLATATVTAAVVIVVGSVLTMVLG